MQNYKVTSIKRWGGAIQGKSDEEGYFMHSLTLEGNETEPIDFKSKHLPAIGETLYGEIVEYTSAAGNHRKRLETAEYKKKENAVQDKIVAQFALRLAVEHASDHMNRDEVMDTARYFIDCVNELTK